MDVTPGILGILAALFMAVMVFETLRRGIVPERFAALWIFVSIVLVVLAIFPQIGAWVARVSGVKVPSNLLFFLAAVLLLLISVQFSYEIGKLDSRTRRLAEDVALLRDAIDNNARGTSPGDSAAPSDPDDAARAARGPG